MTATGAPGGSAKTRVAAIDIGTNSVLLLVADATLERGASQLGEPQLTKVEDLATITRLGKGVDKTRVLSPEAIERTLACLEGYAARCRELGVVRIDAVGTSAMRDAQGADAFRERAKALLGVEPRVIAGKEEARLTFLGGLSGLLGDGQASTEGASVFDIGGGSTEFIRGAGARVDAAVSLDVGSVRLTERFVRSDPPARSELDDIERFITEALGGVPPEALATPLIGVAGTVTTIAAIARGIDPYDGAAVHGMTLSLSEIREVEERLSKAPLAARKKTKGLSADRADVIVAGAVLLRLICEKVFATHSGELRVSDRGVRWGVAAEIAAKALSAADGV